MYIFDLKMYIFDLKMYIFDLKIEVKGQKRTFSLISCFAKQNMKIIAL